MQVLSVVNFKGGSGKTTTAAHLAQYLALTGHRVLAIDLDPQASLSALHGIQPELDKNPSLYEALRYDEDRKPISHTIRPTNFPGLDIVPANLELQEYEYETPLAASDRGSTKEERSSRESRQRLKKSMTVRCRHYRLPSSARLSHPHGADRVDLSADHGPSPDARHTVDDSIPADARRNPAVDQGGGRRSRIEWLRYLVTRDEPIDVPQAQMVGFMQSMFARNILAHPMVKTTAIRMRASRNRPSTRSRFEIHP